MTKRFKYPKTPHLPWSPSSKSDDDLVLRSTKTFQRKEVVITEKLDGENTSMYTDYVHARSTSYTHHPARNWVKKLHADIGHLIPEGWRLCGENMYAKHSILYESLNSYFYLFSIWDESNQCLSWKQTLEWANLLGLETPPEFYLGSWDEEKARKLPIDTTRCEGYVVRITGAFTYHDFQQCVAKWVREEHIQTDQRWRHQKIIPNQLKMS